MSHLPPESSRVHQSKSVASIEADSSLLSDSKEMQLYQHTVVTFKPTSDVARKLFAHSLSQQMKHSGLYDKMQQVVNNRVLQQAASEDYVKFVHQLMHPPS